MRSVNRANFACVSKGTYRGAAEGAQGSRSSGGSPVALFWLSSQGVTDPSGWVRFAPETRGVCGVPTHWRAFCPAAAVLRTSTASNLNTASRVDSIRLTLPFAGNEPGWAFGLGCLLADSRG